MASTYSTSLRLELMATGDQSGTWGDTTNTNLGTLLEQAITGVLSVAQGDVANLTLTNLNGASDQARNAVVNLTGAMTAGRNVVVPAPNKLYLIKNSTTGGFAVTVKTPSGTGVTVPAGTARWVYADGTNVVDGISGPLSPSANDAQALGFSGTAWADLFLASGGVINWNAGNVTLTQSANALAFAGVTSGVSMDGALSLSTTAAGTLQTLTSTDAGATVGPVLDLYRNSASPAASDILGQVIFNGKDSAANKQEYASIPAAVGAPTSTSEDGAIDSYTTVAGTRALRASVGAGAYMAGATGGDQGAGTVNATGLYVNGVLVRSGGLVLLTSGTVSAAATLDIVLTSYTSYRGIVFELSNFVPATGGAYLAMRVSTNGGSSYNSGATDYHYAVQSVIAGAGAFTDSSTGASLIAISNITGGIGGGATAGGTFAVSLLGQTSTSAYPKIFANGVVFDGSSRGVVVGSAGIRIAAQDTDAVRFLFSSGNIDSGSYAVYGYV